MSWGGMFYTDDSGASVVFPDVLIGFRETPPGHGPVFAFQPEVLPVFQSQRGEPATVGTAGVQGDHACDPFGRRGYCELRPVSEEDP